MRGLTERQLDVLEYIADYTEVAGYPPTVAEMMDHFGIRSTNGMSDHVEALERKGQIRRTPYKARAIRITANGRANLEKRAQSRVRAIEYPEPNSF